MAQTELHKYSTQERANKRDADVITVTLTTDAETIGDNKVIAQSIELPYVASIPGGTTVITSVTLLDKTVTGPAVDLLFSSTSDAITGDEGKTIGEDVDDLDSVFTNFVGHVKIAASDWVDMFDSKLGTKTNIQLVAKTASGTDSLWVHAVNRSGANWVATATTDMQLKLGVVKDQFWLVW